MRKEEQRLWNTMRNNKPRRILLNRVENYVGAGMPDVYLRSLGLAVWVELKSPTAPKKVTTRLLGDQGLSVEQINWHLESASLELPTWILIRDSLKRLWVAPGRMAVVINELTAVELDAQAHRCKTWHDAFMTITTSEL